ncbi:MAG: DUF4870 domain-containing protein [Candidatus Pacearchaeota archaeon]|nr:DUF4870 domain-containing protein [Candidatus Pacearchaeota archaeon]
MVKKGKSNDGERKLFAFLGVFLTVIGFIIALATKKDDDYVMFYAKQGLVLFIASVILWVIGMIFVFLPFIGWFLMSVLWIGWVLLWIIGMIYSVSEEKRYIPLIGKFADKF